jgi:hypothetical protein
VKARSLLKCLGSQDRRRALYTRTPHQVAGGPLSPYQGPHSRSTWLLEESAQLALSQEEDGRQEDSLQETMLKADQRAPDVEEILFSDNTQPADISDTSMDEGSETTEDLGETTCLKANFIQDTQLEFSFEVVNVKDSPCKINPESTDTAETKAEVETTSKSETEMK